MSSSNNFQEKWRQKMEALTHSVEGILDEFSESIYVADIETYELLYVNRVACATMHMAWEEMIGRKCYEIIQNRTSPCPYCTNALLCYDKFYEWEFHNPIMDKTLMLKDKKIDWKGRAARIEIAFDALSSEYTIAKKDRERENLIKTIPGGFVRIDARDYSTVLWYGEGFLEMIGYTREQFEKELHSKCNYIHPEDMARAQAIMQAIKKTGENVVIEVRVRTYDGNTKIFTLTLSYVSGEDSWDGIPSFYSVGIDTTHEREEQMRQQKALEEAFQSLRVANAAKTSFLSTMSHDIRTPMNAIVGMTAIAKKNLHSLEKMEDCLDKIDVSSQHLLGLINEVLDMSKIESGTIILNHEDVNIPDLIQNISDMCRPLIKEKRQKFRINISQVRHENIATDGERLQQILMNLLSNAIKYTPKDGNISLIINELSSPSPEKGWFEFVLEDDGIGMSAEFIPKIFEPFTRAEDSRISKIQGTGLGMAITENIVHMMNGTISVKSKPGEGSRFTVTIPLQIQTEKEIINAELMGLSVLVVDEDKLACANTATMLNELGMCADEASSEAEALRMINEARQKQEDYFAVLLDWMLAGKSSLEAVRTIRREFGEGLPIIIVSGEEVSEMEEEFIQAGGSAFLSIPLFKSRLLHVLQQFFAQNLERKASDTDDMLQDLSGKRVLLAEDNEINSEIVVELLKMWGIDTETAENGAQAVHMFRKSAPGYYAAILMDIQMPVMNGYEATGAIRSIEREDAARIPILALTANAFVSDIGEAQSAGMNDHIAKPIDADRLIRVLNKWINRLNL